MSAKLLSACAIFLCATTVQAQDNLSPQKMICGLVCPPGCTISISDALRTCTCTCETADLDWASKHIDLKKVRSVPLTFQADAKGNLYLAPEKSWVDKANVRPVPDYVPKSDTKLIPDVQAGPTDPTGPAGVSVAEAMERERERQRQLRELTGDDGM